MPAFDRTGPAGAGPRTGRGFGPCCGGFGWMFGFGRGRGQGRGLRRLFGWGRTMTKEEQLKGLSEYRKALEEEIEDVQKEEKDLQEAEK